MDDDPFMDTEGGVELVEEFFMISSDVRKDDDFGMKLTIDEEEIFCESETEEIECIEEFDFSDVSFSFIKH